MHYIDTHAHLNDEAFKNDLPDVIAAAQSAGAERLLLPATDLASTQEVVAIAEQYPDLCFPMIGLHPEDINPEKMKELNELEKLLSVPNPFIAIGEIGLDYYWDTTYSKEQCKAFETQVCWSIKYKLPLMIHCRKAQADLLSILSAFPKDSLKGVFHCFSGTAEEAVSYLEYPNFYIGIGGIVTFKKSTLPEVLSSTVPLDRIVLETDCPYMAPAPNRGKRNEPSFVPYVAEKLSQVYQTTIEQVMAITTQTAKRLFFPDEAA